MSVWHTLERHPVELLSTCSRDVQIPKCCVRISPRILTIDPHPRPRPEADAVSDPLSVRDSLSDSDPCLHLTNRSNGLSTLRHVLRRICRGHKSKVMLPTAVNRSKQKQQRKYMNNQQLVFQVKSTKRTHEHWSHNPHASVPATWLLVHGCMVL